MSETHELVREAGEMIQDGIRGLVSRLDVLAGKLGIAAEHIWTFTVTAMAVDARRDLAKSAALSFVPILLFGWSLHVGFSRIPHEQKDVSQQVAVEFRPCDQIGTVNGIQQVLHEQCGVNSIVQPARQVDGDISSTGWLLIGSGFLAAIIGVFILGIAVAGMIDAIANIKTVEYDAFHDLLDTIRE
jgi:hypothetical protein